MSSLMQKAVRRPDDASQSALIRRVGGCMEPKWKPWFARRTRESTKTAAVAGVNPVVASGSFAKGVAGQPSMTISKANPIQLACRMVSTRSGP